MAVAAGSIAFVAFSADNASEGFAFVVLEPIAAGESIRFVDGGKNNTTLTADAQLVWTNGDATLPVGTLVQISLGTTPSNAATATGGGSITTQPSGWNLDSAGADSLFAVTGTVAAPGTYVAALVYGDNSIGTLTTGASIVNLSAGAATLDVGSISSTVANTAYATTASAKTAYTNASNWVRDGAINDGAGTNNAEWPAFGDANSPLSGKTALNVAAPTVTFNDANGRINAAEAMASPVTIAGLAPGSTAVVTFKSSAGNGTVTATFTGDSQQNVNFSPLPDGTISITQVVVTSSGTTSTLASTSTALLDESPPTTTTTIAMTDTGTAGDGITSDPTLSGTFSNTNVSNVTIFDGTTVLATVAATNGNWTYTPTGAAAADGTHSYSARPTDLAGNYGPASATVPATVTVDKTAPLAPASVALANDTGSSASDGITSIATIKGVAEAGSTVTLKIGATTVGTGTADGSGNFSIAPTSGLVQGSNTISVTATDAAGTASAAASVTFTYDTAAPTNATTIALASDTGTSGSDHLTANPTLSGTVTGATAGQSVTILEGTTIVGTATIGAGGAWSFANASASDGAHSYTAAVTDAAGNRGPATAAFTVTVDKAAPSAPAIGTVADNTGAIQGALADGAATDDNTLSLAGTAQAGAAVKVFNGATQVATATADGSGNWTATTAILGDGPVSLTATATDAAGNASTASTARTATVDTAAPTVSSVAYGANDGALAAGEAVNLTVAFSEAVTVAGGTPSLALNSGGTATYVSGSGTGTLTFTYTPAAGQTAADLAVTGFNLNGATVKDAAGNAANTAAAAANPAGTLAVDTAAPTASGVAYGSNDGALAAGETVNLTIAFSEAVTVAGGTPSLALNSGGTATYVSGSGTGTLVFAYTPAVGQTAADLAVTGFNLNGATVKDAAGNAVNTAAGADIGNPAGILAVDTAAAAVTSIAASGTGITGGNGAVKAGDTVTLTVNTGEAVIVAGTPTLTLSSGGTATYDAANSTSTALRFTYMVAEGQNVADLAVTTVNGTIKDAAGNSLAFDSAATGNPAGTLVVDTTPPAATTTIGLVSDTGTPDDGVTVSSALSGTVSNGQSGITVVVFDGATALGAAVTGAGGDWSFTPVGGATAEGTHSYTASVADAAGNLGPASAPLAVTLDRSGDDDLSFLATPDADSIAGGGGSDTIEGLDGDDTLWGDDTAGDPDGDGADIIRGGAGNDSVVGGAGADSLWGNEGVDTILGGAGDDTINGESNNDAGDVIDGGEGRDEFSYYGGEDLVIDLADGTSSSGATLVSIEDVWSDTGNDLIKGSADANHIRGWLGNDTLEGAAGSDFLEGEEGDDSVSGDEGDDTLSGGAGTDTLYGGAGVDTVAFDGNRADYTVASGTDEGGQFFTVADNNPADGDDGTDKVYGAEFLRFADQTDPVCFMPGTLVATPSGEVAVETLRAGDLVLTADGRAAPIRWLGRQTVSTRFADPLRVLPVRIAAGALGENLPRRDLLVSADHALLLDGALVQAGALVNGATVRREARVPEVFTYWHVELADHALVLAEGVAAESFIDNVARLAFDNWAEHGAAAEPAPIAELALPRAKSARQVPQATRRRLAERAATLAGAHSAAA